jgi:hypothetical protein
MLHLTLNLFKDTKRETTLIYYNQMNESNYGSKQAYSGIMMSNSQLLWYKMPRKNKNDVR